MRLEGGKQYGRYWMANSAVDSASVPNLDEIRSRSTGSSIPIRPWQQSSQHMMAQLQVSTVLLVVHCFYTYTLPLHCLKLAGEILQAQLQAQAEQVQRLQAQQEAQAEVHRRKL